MNTSEDITQNTVAPYSDASISDLPQASDAFGLDEETDLDHRDKPITFRGNYQRNNSLSAEDLALDASIKSRAARDLFVSACESDVEEDAEINFAESKHQLHDLWAFTKVRGTAFRDLLGMLDAATKKKSFNEFTVQQKSVIREAFNSLRTHFLDHSAVSEHLSSFAKHDIDILGPIRKESSTRYTITVEPAE